VHFTITPEQVFTGSLHWRLYGEKSYETENPGLGYSRRYVSKASWIDVFVYDLRRKWQAGIQNPGFPRHLESTLDDLRTHARSGVYRDLEVGEPLDLVLLGQPFRAVKMQYRLDGKLISSSLYLTALRGKLLKYRVSVFAASGQDVTAAAH